MSEKSEGGAGLCKGGSIAGAGMGGTGGIAGLIIDGAALKAYTKLTKLKGIDAGGEMYPGIAGPGFNIGGAAAIPKRPGANCRGEL